MQEMKTNEIPPDSGARDFTSPADQNVANPFDTNYLATQLVKLVSEQPFFKGLKEEHLQLLAKSAMVTEFKTGEWIFRQGDPANRFYLILKGKVLIESEIQERGTIPIRTFGPGDDLAWAWLFPPYYMHFSARAIEPTRAIFFYGTRLREQCEANHELGYQLMKRIAEMVVQNLNATQKRLLECTCMEKGLN
jgi:CRP/FNR family cyclic AMP-dependent transcriptional regulator